MPASRSSRVDTFIGTGVYQTGAGDADFPLSYVASDNVLGGRMAARALAKAIGEKGKVYVSNVKPGISTTDQREEGFKDEIAEASRTSRCWRPSSTTTTPTRRRRSCRRCSPACRISPACSAPTCSRPLGAANGVKQAGKTGKVKVVAFDAPESIVDNSRPACRPGDRPASGRDRLFRRHGGLCPSDRQSGPDRDRHRLHGDDKRQHRRPERRQVPLQERIALSIIAGLPPSRKGGGRRRPCSRETRMAASRHIDCNRQYAAQPPAARSCLRIAELRAWLFLVLLIVFFEVWARLAYGGTLRLQPLQPAVDRGLRRRAAAAGARPDLRHHLGGHRPVARLHHGPGRR